MKQKQNKQTLPANSFGVLFQSYIAGDNNEASMTDTTLIAVDRDRVINEVEFNVFEQKVLSHLRACRQVLLQDSKGGGE